MKITDLKCAIIGDNPIVRITTDEGIEGLGQAEWTKPYLKPFVLYYRDAILGQDPTDVERVISRIRRLGSFKPWGAAVSAIEVALWDIAGKAAGVPVYKLLGGKVRDKVRVYNGGIRVPLKGNDPEHFAENMAEMKEFKEGFSIIKQGISFHSQMAAEVPNYFYGELPRYDGPPRGGVRPPVGGPLTEKGLKHTIACVEAMKDVLGDEVGLALDCGPGMTVHDTLRLAKALEPLNIMWLEDTITGDYTPYVLPELFREVQMQTSTPIHTGEQIYLRQNFKDLIESKAVRVIGPDPLDVGGIAELKWIAEFADMHGIMMAPHGVADGIIGIAAHVHLAATLPRNYIAFEYPAGKPEWWYDIMDGLPDPIVENSHIKVWDTPGLGVEFNVPAAKKLPIGRRQRLLRLSPFRASDTGSYLFWNTRSRWRNASDTVDRSSASSVARSPAKRSICEATASRNALRPSSVARTSTMRRSCRDGVRSMNPLSSRPSSTLVIVAWVTCSACAI